MWSRNAIRLVALNSRRIFQTSLLVAPKISAQSNVSFLSTSSRLLRQDRLFSRVELELRAYQPAVLKSYSWFIETAAKELDVSILMSEREPEAHKTRKSLLKSAFAHGKHKAQYEMRTYYWLITLEKLTESTKDTFLEYIQRNLPEGVAMKVVSHELKRLPESILQSSVKEIENK